VHRTPATGISAWRNVNELLDNNIRTRLTAEWNLIILNITNSIAYHANNWTNNFGEITRVYIVYYNDLRLTTSVSFNNNYYKCELIRHRSPIKMQSCFLHLCVYRFVVCLHIIILNIFYISTIVFKTEYIERVCVHEHILLIIIIQCIRRTILYINNCYNYSM
jgi:hypothetical protein